MPRILEALPLAHGGRRYCVVLPEALPAPGSPYARARVAGREFDLLLLDLDGLVARPGRPAFALDVTGSCLEAAWFVGRDLEYL